MLKKSLALGLFAGLLMVATFVWGAVNSPQSAVGLCACCGEACQCAECVCDELGCACDEGGDCFCTPACCHSCCAK